MEDAFDILGLTFDEMKTAVKQIRASGRTPFFHYTQRASVILQGPLIDEILGDLYATFDTTWHEGFIVPFRYKNQIESDDDL